MLNSPATRRSLRSEPGFTFIEVLAVCALIGIIAAVAVPQTNNMMNGYRLKGSAEALHNTVVLAKMRAAAQFSRARVRADLGARTFQLEVWDKANDQWVTDGSPLMLAHGVTFGFADIASPPPNTQAAITQSPVCTDDGGAALPDTACVTFNSRGMPVDNALPPAGSVVANSAFYITDGTAVYGTTITAAPFIRFWWSRNATDHWVQQ